MWPFTRQSPDAERAPTQDERIAAELAFEKALGNAAAIPSAVLTCRPDTWRLADTWARSRAAYRPPAPGALGHGPNGTQEIRLSGLTMVSLLFALWDKGNSSSTDAANLGVAARMFTAITEAVNSADPNVKNGTRALPIIVDPAR
jgi:hypothetical protein